MKQIEQMRQEGVPLIEKNIEESGIVSLLEELRDKTPGAELIRNKPPGELPAWLTMEPSEEIVPCSAPSFIR